MNRTTIDFGIDLGTTNSAIAVLRGTLTDIIKNNLDNDITPSAVFIDRKDGQTHVGMRARNRMEDQRSANDVYAEFKRRMGTDYKYTFQSTGKTMLPEELSAEVLKTLKDDVRRVTGESVSAAVITVPAAFEQKQCAATKRAGELAGLLQCPLLQEPVAAALAHGFQADVSKEYWLVYDFGGGTFDAAVMKAEEGSINVVNHGGDNYLGGSDIDWAIIEQLILPKLPKNFNLPNFTRSNRDKEWKSAFAVLKRAVEDAKILLSASETAFLERCHFKDADDEDVDLEIKLTRNEVVNVAEPIIMRSVEICRRVLKEKGLAPSAIEKVILVGGPTKAPYFRQMLQASLGIPLDHTVDPLTVVARGAAVFAGTQRLEGKAAAKAVMGQFNVKLAYKTMGPDTDPRVRGEVSSTDGASLDAFTIELVNHTPEAKDLLGWRSGKIPLKSDGKFQVQLEAEKGMRNIYDLELLDKSGRRQQAVPDTLVYTVTGGAGVISEQPIINSIGIALKNNDSDFFFRKGDPLPAKATRTYRSTHTVTKGSKDEVLNVPVIEGEIERADRNRLLGKLVINGAQVRRDVPGGSEIEVTLHYDSSRIIKASAYIPILDEVYEVVINHDGTAPDPKTLKQTYATEMSRLAALREKASESPDENTDELLATLEEESGLDVMIEAAKGDVDAARQAESRILELKVKLDHIEDSLKWPSLVVDVGTALDELDSLVDEHGSAEQKEQAAELREAVDDLIAKHLADNLRKKMEQIADLHRAILFEQPGFWVGFFNHLVSERKKMSDQATSERLINQGRQFINQGNLQGLRTIVTQLLQQLPRDIAADIQHGYQSGLLK